MIKERDITNFSVAIPTDRRKATEILLEGGEGRTLVIPLAMSSPVAKLILAIVSLVVNHYNSHHRYQLH